MANARQDVRKREVRADRRARDRPRRGQSRYRDAPTARLAGVELEIRPLGLHRERLVDTRTPLVNELRWQRHDLCPESEILARDVIARVRELTRTITQL